MLDTTRANTGTHTLRAAPDTRKSSSAPRPSHQAFQPTLAHPPSAAYRSALPGGCTEIKNRQTALYRSRGRLKGARPWHWHWRRRNASSGQGVKYSRGPREGQIRISAGRRVGSPSRAIASSSAPSLSAVRTTRRCSLRTIPTQPKLAGRLPSISAPSPELLAHTPAASACDEAGSNSDRKPHPSSQFSNSRISARCRAHRLHRIEALGSLSLLLIVLFLLPLALAASSSSSSTPTNADADTDDTPSDNDGDTMTVACADTSLSSSIPAFLQSHPFDSSSHYFSVASNLFCAKRPGFIIQRVYLSNNASEVVTDDDTRELRRVCEETLGVVEGTEGTWARDGSGDGNGSGKRWLSGRQSWADWGVGEGSAVSSNQGRGVSEGRIRSRRQEGQQRRQAPSTTLASSTSDQASSGAPQALSTGSTSSTSSSPSSSSSPTPTSTSRAQLHRGATYSNREGVWVVDICAIPPELLEQDDLVWPPPEVPVGEVDAAMSSQDTSTLSMDDNEGESEEDADAKAMESRRKERMVMMIQAIEGTGIQGMSVAGSKKLGAAGRRAGSAFVGVGGKGTKGKVLGLGLVLGLGMSVMAGLIECGL